MTTQGWFKWQLFLWAFFAIAADMTCTPSLSADLLAAGSAAALDKPLAGTLKYPFTKAASMSCGHWLDNSMDYPYFGAPREKSPRRHAGVDLYPKTGVDTAVQSMQDGIVVKIAPFYKRKNGEITYAVLIDHQDFVANYAEIKRPEYAVGTSFKRGDTIGRISGTGQLHLEIYAPGSRSWSSWRKERPANLIDPTPILTELYGIAADS